MTFYSPFKHHEVTIHQLFQNRVLPLKTRILSRVLPGNKVIFGKEPISSPKVTIDLRHEI